MLRLGVVALTRPQWHWTWRIDKKTWSWETMTPRLGVVTLKIEDTDQEPIKTWAWGRNDAECPGQTFLKAAMLAGVEHLNISYYRVIVNKVEKVPEQRFNMTNGGSLASPFKNVYLTSQVYVFTLRVIYENIMQCNQKLLLIGQVLSEMPTYRHDYIRTHCLGKITCSMLAVSLTWFTR